MQHIAPNDFKRVGDLGQGVAGDVYRYQYNGNDPEILRLTDSKAPGGYLAVKIAKPERGLNAHLSQNEKKIKEQLNNTQDPNAESVFPKSHTIEMNGKEWQLSELVYYAKAGNNFNASNLHIHWKSFNNNHFFACRSEQGPQIAAGIAFALNGFSQSMQDALHALHVQHRVIHADCGTHNFLVCPPSVSSDGRVQFNVKSTDFGLSSAMNEQGEGRLIYPKPKGEERLQIPKAYWTKASVIAYESEDNSQFEEQRVNLQTDFCNFRAGLIEMIGDTLGVHRSAVFTLGEQKPSEFSAIRSLLSDEKVLEKYLENVNTIADNSQKISKDARGELMLSFIESYRPFLTHITKTEGLSVEEACQREQALFSQCAADFAAKLNDRPMDLNRIQEILFPAPDADELSEEEEFEEELEDENEIAEEEDLDESSDEEDEEEDEDEEELEETQDQEFETSAEDRYANAESSAQSELDEEALEADDAYGNAELLADHDEEVSQADHAYGNAELLAQPERDEKKSAKIPEASKAQIQPDQPSHPSVQANPTTKLSSTQRMFSQIAARPASATVSSPVVAVAKQPENEAELMKIVRSRQGLYNEKNKFLVFSGGQDFYKNLVAKLEQKPNIQERIQILEDEYFKLEKQYQATHSTQQSISFSEALNNNKNLYHYPRSIALALQDISRAFPECKTEQTERISKVQSYSALGDAQKSGKKAEAEPQEKVEQLNQRKFKI